MNENTFAGIFFFYYFFVFLSFFFSSFCILTQSNLSWRRSLSYTNQSIDLQSKSMDWFLYDNGLCHERVKCNFKLLITTSIEIQFKKRKFKNYFHVTDDMVCFNRPYSFKFFKGWLPLNLTWFILEYFVSIDHLILLLFGLVFIRTSLTQVIYKKLFWKILQNSQARSLLKRESDTGVL